MRKVEKRKCGKCGKNNHRDERCPSVRLWEDGWKLKRGWHKREKRAIVRKLTPEPE